VLGKAAFLLLRENEPTVGDHVVLALRSFERLGVEALLRQLSRETRGSYVVAASDGAVEDLDAHARHRNHVAKAVARDADLKATAALPSWPSEPDAWIGAKNELAAAGV
jgi:hypothetical protein